MQTGDIFSDIFVTVIIILSVVLHEVAHGYVANALGDPTARLMGRLTLNPLKHLDPFGSVILPAMLAITHSPIFFGWAKPVPYNPYNIQNKNGELYVALAGPATNLLLAVIFGVVFRVAGAAGVSSEILTLIFAIVATNTMLAIFNLIPIPPMDGSKVLAGILPRSLSYGYDRFRQNFEANPIMGFAIILVFLYIFGNAFSMFVYSVSTFIAGV